MTSRAFNRYCRIVVGFGLALVAAGASVTSTGSALAVPDWPLSYGKVLPPMTGGIFFEHGHRMIASLVGLLTLILAAWAWGARLDKRLRWLTAGAVLAVCAQGLLGGITVLYQLPKPVSIAHACLGQTFFCLLAVIALVSSPDWEAPAAGVPAAGALKRLSWLAAALLYAQLVLGASFRHGAAPILPHLVGAAVAAPALLWACVAGLRRIDSGSPLVARPKLALVLLGVQLILGVSSLATWSPWATAAHVACGAALLATAVTWAVELACRLPEAAA